MWFLLWPIAGYLGYKFVKPKILPETATTKSVGVFAQKVAADLIKLSSKTIEWSKRNPESGKWEDALTQSQWSEIRAVYTELTHLKQSFLAFLQTHHPKQTWYEKLTPSEVAKDFTTVMMSEAIYATMKNYETNVRELGQRFEKAYPKGGSATNAPFDPSEPQTIVDYLVWGGVVVGSGYVAIKGYKMLKS